MRPACPRAHPLSLERAHIFDIEKKSRSRIFFVLPALLKKRFYA